MLYKVRHVSASTKYDQTFYNVAVDPDKENIGWEIEKSTSLLLNTKTSKNNRILLFVWQHTCETRSVFAYFQLNRTWTIRRERRKVVDFLISNITNNAQRAATILD